MRTLFAELRRVLADDGTLWLNLGDSYSAPGKTSALQGRRVQLMQNIPSKGTDRAPKNLLGIPWRVAFALQDDGWILRSDIVWAKTSSMPEAVRDRPTRAHEFVFLLAKSPRYHYDADAIAEPASGATSGDGFARPQSVSRGGRGQDARWEGRPQLVRAHALAAEKGLTGEHLAAIRAVGMSDAGKAAAIQSGSGRNGARVQALADEAKAALGGYYREFLTAPTRNARDVWTIPTQPFAEAHFAVMPLALAEKCVQAGCRPAGTVLDPFSGSGTTGLAAARHGRKYIGIDLNAEYLDLSLRTRLAQSGIDFGNGETA